MMAVKLLNFIAAALWAFLGLRLMANHSIKAGNFNAFYARACDF
jgi:hypothetical protein